MTTNSKHRIPQMQNLGLLHKHDIYHFCQHKRQFWPFWYAKLCTYSNANVQKFMGLSL